MPRVASGLSERSVRGAEEPLHLPGIVGLGFNLQVELRVRRKKGYGEVGA